ncbi:unnamed protein product [Mytilus edulis]|uniref:Uncharacterized protein n=1 Tax=Mytilus edulis TaxID=6550 RepID=A0A8S3VBJ7_MYTED|nr:unnamed protein product [Mytilus edulis]
MFLQAKYAAENGYDPIVIKSSDTDVEVLACFVLNCHLHAFQMQIIKCAINVPGFTGCDLVSASFCKGISKTFGVLTRSVEFLEGLSCLGKPLKRKAKSCRKHALYCNACTLRSTTTSVIRLGIHPAIVNPIVCAKIIRQLCYPKALYGCELWGKLTCTEILMLERTHHYICKFIQGLPRRTRSDMCVSLLGWLSIESFICERKLLFFGRTCRLPYSAVSFRILLRRLIDARYNQYDTRSGFACDIIEILTKYGLSKYLDQFLNDGQFSSSATWKSVVKTSIYQVEVVKWHHRMAVDPDFVVFKDIHSFCVPHAAWRVALRHPLMRRQAHFVTSTCCLIRENLQNNRILCDKCGKLFDDPCTHAILSCDYTVDARDQFWRSVIDINPITFSVHLGNMTDNKLLNCILACDTDFDLQNEEREQFNFIDFNTDCFVPTENSKQILFDLENNKTLWEDESTADAIQISQVNALLKAIEKGDYYELLKLYYRAQHHHTLCEQDIPVDIPVYINRDVLEDTWIPHVEHALKAINTVTPGINLYETYEVNKSKIEIGVHEYCETWEACTMYGSILKLSYASKYPRPLYISAKDGTKQL